jgi:tRNA A37 threonylcarbamoyladenosine modification protein TsaB
MKGICCSLRAQLIGVNKFETLSIINEPTLISLKYTDNKIYWCIFKDKKPILMSYSEIQEIKPTDDYSDLIVVGYKAKEIAKNIKVKKFIEKNETSIQDFLKFSRKIVKPEKFLPQPLYISPGQSLFVKYKGPKILDKPLDAS